MEVSGASASPTVRPFSIRPATAADGLAAASVVEPVFREYGFTWDKEYMSDLYDLDGHYLSNGHEFWVATLEIDLPEVTKGTIVGTCGLELFPRFPGSPGTTTLIDDEVRAAGADCSLERLYVLPDARNLGLGSALLRTAIQKGLDEARAWMEIWSDKKLTLAHQLYERFGAIRVGERICDDPDESPEWGMALELKSELLMSRREKQ